MSSSSGAERIGVLREAIARIETGGARAHDHGGQTAGFLCEILPAKAGDATAACGHALALALKAAGEDGAIVWIAEDFVWRERGAPYGPGLVDHGLDPARLTLVRAPGPRQALWALEEALKSTACAAAIGEIHDSARHCDLAATRRLAVAARAGGSLGLLLHQTPVAEELSTAARERFEIAALPARARASAGRRRPIPEAPVWRVRALKSRPIAGLLTPLADGPGQTIVWGAPDEDIHAENLTRNKERSSATLSVDRDRARARA